MLTPGQQDKLIKMAKGSEPSAVELNDTNWKANPGLAIDTLWEGYGKQNYPRKLAPIDQELKEFALAILATPTGKNIGKDSNTFVAALADLEQQKIANADAQPFKKKITDSAAWKDTGSLDKIDIVPKGQTGVILAPGNYIVK